MEPIRRNLHFLMVPALSREISGVTSDYTAQHPLLSPDQGAATSVLLAVSPMVAGIGGRYFEDCTEALPNAPGTRRGVAPHALDPEAAARLWQVSLEHLSNA